MTTVLFTCVGQRVEIINAFRRAGAHTIGADLSRHAAALYHADAQELIPRYDDPGYIDALAALVEAHDVDLVLPLTDLDQLVLSQNRAALGALVLLPEPEAVLRSNDKFEAHRFLSAAGIGSPTTWLAAELPADPPFPLFLKLRFGSGSKQLAVANDQRELEVLLDLMESEPVIQQRCVGDEFSIDVFSDLDGICVNAIPRTMIESKAGETVKGATINDTVLVELGREVAETFGVVGPATIQCFREPDGRHLVTDINLRFGGGFPLPTAAGSQYPEYALALARGESLEPRVGVFEEGVVLACYPTQVILKKTDDGLELYGELLAS